MSAQLIEQVLAQRPTDGAAWYLLGLSKQRLGQPAESELRKAVEYRPYLFSAYYRLWQLALNAGDTNQAQSYLAHFKAPKSVDFLKALPKTGSGKIYKKGLRDPYTEPA